MSWLVRPTYFSGLLIAASIVGGVAVASIDPAYLVAALMGIVCLGVVAASSMLFVRSLRTDGSCRMLGSAVVSGAALLAVVIPAYQLLADQRPSRLARAGFVGPSPSDQAINSGLLLCLVCVVAFFVSELVISHREVSRATSRSKFARSITGFFGGVNSKHLYLVMTVAGLGTMFALASSISEAAVNRGSSQGVGHIALLVRMAPLAVAIAVIERHWGSRQLVVLSTFSIVASVALTGGSRSMALFPALALALRFVVESAKARHFLRRAFAALIVGWVVLALLVSISVWRGSLRSGSDVEFTQVFASQMVNPVGSLASRGGLETFDGLTLALFAERSELDIHWWDPVKAIVYFVPRSVWDSKPDFVGQIVTQQYTEYTFGGMFMSGPGYTYLVFGGMVGAAIAFAVLGCASGLMFRRRFDLATVFAAYFFQRFFVAGDAYDVFFVLNAVLAIAVAVVAVRIARLFFRPASGSQPDLSSKPVIARSVGNNEA